MRRAVFDEDHESFRKTLRAFIQAEVVPHYQEWYEAGIVPRDFYYKLGDLGIFGIEVPEEYGGAASPPSSTTPSRPRRPHGPVSRSAAPASTRACACPTC